MRKTLDARLKAAEQTAAAVSKFAAIRSAIRNSAFYDELPECDRSLYCEYRGVDRTTLESVTLTATGSLHCVLCDNETPTPEELKKIIAEVEQMVTEGA